jgi:hypothetical protein
MGRSDPGTDFLNERSIEVSMLNSSPGSGEPTDDDLDAVIKRGPKGAIVVAGIASFIVVAIWLAFYFFVFVPRGFSQ